FYFIRIGGQFAYKKAQPNPGLGLAGAIPGAIALAEAMLPREEIAAFDQTPTGEVLGQHRHDMAISLAAIASSRLVPPPMLSGHGGHWGRWLLTLRDGTKWTFQFMKREDVEVGMQELPSLLGEKQIVKLRLEEKREEPD